ncbi:Piwi-like protein 2 [Tyrophagus putrescentiae]|nr:Piwi-like protein 2 [Tyrophagus putrescentiae]
MAGRGRGRALAKLHQAKEKEEEEELFPCQLQIPSLEEEEANAQFEDDADDPPPSDDILNSIPCLEEDEDDDLDDPKSADKREKIEVLTNFIRLLRTPGYDVYLYQLKIESPSPSSSSTSSETVALDSKSIRQLLDSRPLQQRLKTSPFMFGDKFYLPTAVPSFSLFPVAVPPHYQQQQQQLSVTITFIKALPLREQLVLFNCLFKRVMHLLGYTFMKTKYFDERAAIHLEQWMMQLWPGFAIDVVAGASGELLLCVDISHRILHRTSVLDQLKMVMGGGQGGEGIRRPRHFVGASVLARYSKVTYRVDDIDFEASPLSLFEVGSSNSQNNKGTTRMTFLEYYRTKWGLEIRELDQPLLVHQKRSTKTGEVRNLYLVPELCNTTGLGLVSDQTAFQKVISTVQPPPNSRYRSLLRYIDLVRECPPASKLLADWGLALEPYTSVAMTADLLREEMILTTSNLEDHNHQNSNALLARHRYLQTKTTSSNWSHLLRHSPLLLPVAIGSRWSVVHSRADTAVTRHFVLLCRRAAAAMSLDLEEPRAVVCTANGGGTSADDFLLAIKALSAGATLGAGNRKLETITPAILVQMVCKLGGAPWGVRMPGLGVSLNSSSSPHPLHLVMYVGIDIYHRKSLKRRSVIGFVASTNSQATGWYSRAYVKVEDTSDLCEGDFLAEATRLALLRYRFFNRRLPTSVVIYRDDVGVPLEKLLRVEYEAMEAAIRGVYSSEEVNRESAPLPVIVFMTVAKRISTKLFVRDEDEDRFCPPLSPATIDRISGSESSQPSRMDPQSRDDNPAMMMIPQVKNPPSGTVLTMNAERFDQFYLVSQKSTVTAACPIRVRVLRNSGSKRNGTLAATGLSAEETAAEEEDLLSLATLQSVSYKLCYLYYNSTSICRQPAPGMYAHKVANFVGEHLETEGAEELHERLFYL